VRSRMPSRRSEGLPTCTSPAREPAITRSAWAWRAPQSMSPSSVPESKRPSRPTSTTPRKLQSRSSR
jgi:hypothetical protein